MASKIQDWEEYYCEEVIEKVPWFHEELDHDLEEALTRLNLKKGDFLDLGTGPGTQAIALAKKGFSVTATDISQTAIDSAKTRASKENVQISFVRNNVLENTLTESFDFVFDRGCFHVFNPDKWSTYLTAIKSFVKPKGYLFLKTFSYLEPGEDGPYRFKSEELESVFNNDFLIESMINTEFRGQMESFPKALFTVLKRK